jgi:hypothetical protein
MISRRSPENNQSNNTEAQKEKEDDEYSENFDTFKSSP